MGAAEHYTDFANAKALAEHRAREERQAEFDAVADEHRYRIARAIAEECLKKRTYEQIVDALCDYLMAHPDVMSDGAVAAQKELDAMAQESAS